MNTIDTVLYFKLYKHQLFKAKRKKECDQAYERSKNFNNNNNNIHMFASVKKCTILYTLLKLCSIIWFCTHSPLLWRLQVLFARYGVRCFYFGIRTAKKTIKMNILQCVNNTKMGRTIDCFVNWNCRLTVEWLKRSA